MARALGIILIETERINLERRARRRKIANADAMRAQIVLLAAAGYGNSAIARAVGATRKTSWRGRFARDRLDGLSDGPRCGGLDKLGIIPSARGIQFVKRDDEGKLTGLFVAYTNTPTAWPPQVVGMPWVPEARPRPLRVQ